MNHWRDLTQQFSGSLEVCTVEEATEKLRPDGQGAFVVGDRQRLLDLGRSLPHEMWQYVPGGLPWRVPEYGDDAAEYGMSIWWGTPLRHRDEPCVDFWNELTEEPAFIDRQNEVRALAAKAVADFAGEDGCSLVEVGPGPGYDYRDAFRTIPGLTYRALEISGAMRRIFHGHAPEADVRVGSFLDLPPGTADIAYTKSTLEHQRDFRDALHRLILAARRCAMVSWYLPPEAQERIRLGERGIWYNVYARSDVLDFIRRLDRNVEIRKSERSPNELWLITAR